MDAHDDKVSLLRFALLEDYSRRLTFDNRAFDRYARCVIRDQIGKSFLQQNFDCRTIMVEAAPGTEWISGYFGGIDSL